MNEIDYCQFNHKIYQFQKEELIAIYKERKKYFAKSNLHWYLFIIIEFLYNFLIIYNGIYKNFVQFILTKIQVKSKLKFAHITLQFIIIILQKPTSNKMAHSGYDRERFINLQFDTFQCIICSEVVMEPWECSSCGKLFCKICITDWMNKNPAAKCPSRCSGSKIAPIFSKALQKMYFNLDIKCSNEKCKKVVKLIDLQPHENFCLKVKCWNFDNCQKGQNEQLKSDRPCCSPICQTLFKLQQNFGNTKKMYEIIGELFVRAPIIMSSSSGGSSKALNQIGWDQSKMGLGIALSEGNSSCFLKEQSYVFRTAIGNIGFTSGVNYWEIVADPKTENQLKIGVTLSRDFDLNSAFCDNNFGFAYYGLGQLRYNSNASGPSYGKRFKKEGVLGVCLNMNTGTLSFALNGEYFGVAYTDAKLKSGPIYPAVSLLHCAGCKIRSGMPVPSYFKD